MSHDLTVEPMGEDFFVWRCLHQGPLSRANVDVPGPNPDVDWTLVRARNIPLLEKLTKTYGACAILAHDGENVVGTLRFYPMALCSFGESGAGFCLQQRSPIGPADDLAARRFPPLEELANKSLFVHCLMIAAPSGDPDRYRRKGLATRMAKDLVRWATEQGWRSIEVNSYEEIPMLYAISGVAGRRFWEPLGFRVVKKDTEPAMTGEILEAVRKDAEAAGVAPGDVTNRYRLRLDLA